MAASCNSARRPLCPTPKTFPPPTAPRARFLKHHGKSYYFSTRLFPRELQEATCALYAFVRLPDEIVDNSPQNTPEEIAAVREKLLDFLARWKSPLKPAIRAIKSSICRPHFSSARRALRVFASVLNAMIQDTEQTRYCDYADLEKYMYGSASCVGLMMSHIIALKKPRTLEHATKLGDAMQLTNFYAILTKIINSASRLYASR